VDAVAERTLAIEEGTVRTYDGGWADYVRVRDERAAPPPAPEPEKPLREPKPEPAPKPKPRQPTQLERLEAEIAGREAEVAELERRLAEDWHDVDRIAAHRRAREELQRLLARWEALYDQNASNASRSTGTASTSAQTPSR
jgi:ATP-binding cassette subfamily F protein 3